ncbi:DNA helicase [Aliihoeflea sp. PC F10.4]
MKLSRPIFHLKRDARIAAKTHGLALHSALDKTAAREGYKSWGQLAAAHARLRPEERLHARLKPGNLVLVGGRPGQGKTLMALKLAAQAAAAGNESVFFTLEYSARNVFERLERIDMPPQSEHLFHADCSNDICANYIEDRLRTARPGTLAVVDYLQILDQRRETPPLTRQVGSLRDFAGRNGLIVAFISQVDRAFDASGRGCPDLSDVRLPNPLDLSVFDHTMFVHGDQVTISQPGRSI